MTVTIYSTPACTYCGSVKRYLREKKVNFKDIDVSRDQKAAQQMIKKSGQTGVPVIDIGGKIIIGFNKPAIDRALNV